MERCSDTKDEPEATRNPTESAANACPLCTQFAEKVHNQVWEQTVGKYGALKNNESCQTCRTLAYAIEEKLGAENVEDEEAELRLYRPPNQDSLHLFVGTHFSDLSMLMAPLNGGNQLFGTTIDRILIQRIIQDCDQNHAGVCHSPLNPWERIQTSVELLMIDVERYCLVPVSGTCRYLALSYVWGQSASPPLQTVVENFESLCREGAFRDLVNRSLLPCTIEDSMLLTRDVGVRYLWVDRFCIIQDDPVQKPAQLKAMASIYANAYFTIAACEGPDGDFGLRGWGTHRPRTIPFFTFDFSSQCRMISREPANSRGGYRRDRYHTRAWTFQEWHISSRLLAFHHQTVSWVCKRTDQQENGCKTTIRCLPPSPYVGQSLMQSKPDIWLYMDNINFYSARFLSYQEDGLEAFSAVIACMERSMRGGIFYGLPEMIFDGALLWRAGDEGRPIRRKNALGEYIKKLPSWSCFGWTQRTNVRFWQLTYNYREEEDGVNRKVSDGDAISLRPLTKFHKVGALTSTRMPIHNKFYIEDQSTGIGVDVSYEQLGSTFKFVFPVPPVSDTHDEPCEPVIEFRTRRLFLKMRRLDPNAPPNPFNREVDNVLIEDDQGTIVGRLDNILREEARSTAAESTLCELIAISAAESQWRGVKASIWKEAEYLHLDCPSACRESGDLSACVLGSDWRYRFYFVLWIEWEDGIAYRKALGRVFQDFWDNAETEEIDVRLG